MPFAKSFNPWLGVGLGLLLCSLPIAAIAVDFNPPRRGLPGRREGAGTRSPHQCVEGRSTLTMVLPETNLGLTTEKYPQFFWYVPKTTAKTAHFILFQGPADAPEQEILYDTTVAIPQTPGVLSVRLPEDGQIPPLEIGKDYYWAITLQCNPKDPVTDIYASGWIHRMPLGTQLTHQLENATPSDRVQLYAHHGLWIDTVSALSDLRCTDPTNPTLAQSWRTLLKSVKLDQIADEPLSTCTRNVEAKKQP